MAVLSFRPLAAIVACALATACASTPSYTEAAIKASDEGDQKAAIGFAKKEVERFSTPDECSRRTTKNCGTLALAYSSLAGYQILAGDKVAGERSFGSAKEALALTDRDNQSSAAGIIYRDVSEAFWKTGDKKRAIAVFNEGREAGADSYLYMCSAAKATGHESPASPGRS